MPGEEKLSNDSNTPQLAPKKSIESGDGTFEIKEEKLLEHGKARLVAQLV